MEKEKRDFFLLQRKIFKTRGFEFQYRPGFLKRRFAVRLRARGVTSYRDYAKILDKDPSEYNSLFDALTINITQFFRDPSVYEAFDKQVLPALISTKRRVNRKIIRIWSAGCASGEEPYSIAILLNKVLKERIKNFVVSVWATDIDKDSLAIAKAGIYTHKSLTEVDRNYSSKYFVYTKGKYIVKEDIKRIVRFNRHNFITEQPYTNFDVIFCRNVTIYLTREMQKKLLETFHKCLNKNGYLIIGRSESLLTKGDLFCLVNPEEHIFMKV